MDRVEMRRAVRGTPITALRRRVIVMGMSGAGMVAAVMPYRCL
jgi:hypothetical protein